MNKSNRKLLPAMATAVVVLLVMCGIGSAGYIGVSKNTVPASETYRIGDTVTYLMTVELTGSPPDGHSIDVIAYDTYPNGTIECMTCTLTKGSVEEVAYTRTYVVDAADIIDGIYDPYAGDDVILNVFNATGYNTSTGNPTGDEATTPCQSKILSDPSANFDFDAGDCDLTVPFTPNATDPDGTIDLYEWDFENDGTIDKTTASDSSFSHTFPASGGYDVNLTVTDNDGLTDWIVKTVYITAPPTVSVTASKTSVTVPPGELVQFTGTVSDPDNDPLDYKWTLMNATGPHYITGSVTGPYPETIGPISCFVDKVPTTVTLTVEDLVGCVASDDVRLGRPPQAVPILTLPGLLALIGMMCIAGAGRILTKGRRS